MAPVYLLTLRQLFGRWRLLIMTALALIPVLFTMLVLQDTTAPSVQEFEAVVFNAMLSGSIAPLVVLSIATAAFANEIEDRTLANLTLSPISRWRIVVPKLLAVITIAGPFMAVSAFVTGYLAFLGDPRSIAAVTVAAVAGVALYSSAFLWIGLVTTQAIAIGTGLLYIVLWEGFFSRFVSGARMLSIRYQSISLAHGLDERRFALGDHLSLSVIVAASVIVFGVFLLLSVRRLRRMDVP